MKSVPNTLRERGVLQTAAIYVAVAWGGTEILAFLVQALWGDAVARDASRYLAILFVAGFPVAMYLAWTRDLGLRARRVAAAATIAIVLVAGLIWLFPASERLPRRTAGSGDGIHSIAVLPLDNLSGDPSQDYFAAGMTEALIARLGGIPDLNVISRTSVMRYVDTTKAIPEIAAELNVDVVVEGSVNRADDTVRITAQLIDAASDTHLWAESFETQIEDVLAAQSEIAHGLAREIGRNLGGAVDPEPTPRRINPAAYDRFLKAQIDYLDGVARPEKVIEAFEQAIDLDPSFAPAYATLADFYGYLALVSGAPADDTYLHSRQLARQALELDPDLASAHAALARVQFQYEWDWQAAEAEFRHALELDPNDVVALGLFGAYRILIHADCDGGLDFLDRARARDPFNPGHHFDAGVYAFHCRRWDESIAHLARAEQLSPGSPPARLIVGWNYYMQGLHEQAGKQCDLLVQEIGTRLDPMMVSGCGWIYGKIGRTEVTNQLLERLRRPPAGVIIDPSWITGPCLALGDRDCAIAALEKAYRQRSSNMIFLRIAVQWGDLADDPRFQAVVSRMDFPS
jgi:TolB-like protein